MYYFLVILNTHQAWGAFHVPYHDHDRPPERYAQRFRRGQCRRDLIRRDKERAEQEAFDRLKAELTRAFAGRETSYRPLTAAEVIARNRA